MSETKRLIFDFKHHLVVLYHVCLSSDILPTLWHSSFAVIWMGKIELVALLGMYLRIFVLAIFMDSSLLRLSEVLYNKINNNYKLKTFTCQIAKFLCQFFTLP